MVVPARSGSVGSAATRLGVHLPERDVLAIRPGVDRMLGKHGFRRGPMTQEFLPPGIEHLIDSDSFAQCLCARVIGCNEYTPGLALAVIITARDRNRPPHVSGV